MKCPKCNDNLREPKDYMWSTVSTKTKTYTCEGFLCKTKVVINI